MLAKRIIPCLDVTAGRVVKGINFVNLRDAGDPVELAQRYNEQGADEVVFLDITASSDERNTMVDVVFRTAQRVFIPLTVGGGIREVRDARRILVSGADKVSVNTAAVRRPELITELSKEFGAQAVVLAIDARRKSPDSWSVHTKGGRVESLICARTRAACLIRRLKYPMPFLSAAKSCLSVVARKMILSVILRARVIIRAVCRLLCWSMRVRHRRQKLSLARFRIITAR